MLRVVKSRIFEDTGLATTFLRPAGFMQNYLSFQLDMVKSGTLYAATGDAPHSLIDTRDIAAAAARILANPAAHAGKGYSLTGDEALTDTQRAAVLTRLLAQPVNFVSVPHGAAIDGMRQSGMPEVLVEWLGSSNALVAAGYASSVSPDFKALLGRPAIGFERFVADHLRAWS